MSEQLIFLDGKFVKKEEAVVSVYDHGFLYGDGIFEGIRAYSGNVFRLDEHLTRLYDSAKSIMLTIPYTKEEMAHIVAETLRKNKLTDGYVRLVVSRGVGDLGLSPYSCEKATVLVIAEPLRIYPKELYETGLDIITVATRRNRSDVLNPMVKSLNYLNNVLVKIEATLAGVPEALMLNDQGYVAEGSADNIFIVRDKKLITPPGHVGALVGITRNAIIDIARAKGYEVEEAIYTRHDVYTADEVFLTGTAAEVIAVKKVDGRIIGDGKPGPITNELLESFRELTLTDGYKLYDELHVAN
ncbi:branched-chain-amino-acid transaminase [Lederbergia citri]|uniref:Branched-chain-amino-acid aminotransferase n=1 Tax=Lederbergia citri TaxID=2833580 RepID=A0A942YIH5_9BACI|nr:branched-chain-amino-acid transaminase [Lederbergia citri]MBS4196969.1 branched-chain-amino-acid transaminase [Lederbergia citri]